jgi:hypothetical protein
MTIVNKALIIGAITVSLLGAVFYYKRRVADIQASQLNPNQSENADVGTLAAPYARATGQIGDTYTSNYRYSEYLQYLNQGGVSSGLSFDQFLTAAQGNSLPSS